MKTFTFTHPVHSEATLTGYVLDCDITMGQETNRPAVIICPGGGYLYCAATEGEPVALAYAARGFHAFVLNYSVRFDAAGFSPLEEVSWVVGLVREHAAEWHIAADQIAVCGFSAGGHLALASGMLAENKPNALLLGYPVASMDGPQNAFFAQLLTGKEHPTAEDMKTLDAFGAIDANAPPAFLFATVEDRLTPYGALAIANAYSKAGVDYELHLFQFGPHGLGLGTAESANGSSQLLNERVAQWHDLSISWLRKIFGEPVFVDKSNSLVGHYLKEMGVKMPEPPKAEEN